MTAPHVTRVLEAIGRINPDGATRRARIRPCPTCRHHTVTGLDDEPCGLAVRTDPTQLDPVQELALLLTGKHTYDLIYGPTLQYRDPPRIRANRQFPVLPEHACGIPRVPDADVVFAFWPHREELPDDPPF
jgi:hypothetical protein